MEAFSDVVDAVDSLSLDEQQALVEIMCRRIAEHRRMLLVQDVMEARSEFSQGNLRPEAVQEIMDDLQP